MTLFVALMQLSPAFWIIFLLISLLFFGGLIYLWRQRRVLQKALALANNELKAQKALLIHQNAVLERQYEHINRYQENLAERNQALETLNVQLEQIVAQRTQHLLQTNKALKEVNDELDSLTYHTAHQLRLPLTRFRGLLRLMRIDPYSKEMPKYLSLLEGSVLNMDYLLAQLQQLHDINTDVSPEQPVVLCALVHQLVQEHLQQQPQSSLLLECQLPSYAVVRTKPELLQIILISIIQNAASYGGRDGQKPYLYVTSEHLPQFGAFVLRFEDNGEGIPPENIAQAFRMFFRGSTKSTGHGLGLFLAKKAADRLNIELRIKSESQAYTRFELWFDEGSLVEIPSQTTPPADRDGLSALA